MTQQSQPDDPTMSLALLTNLFSSLARTPNRWTLLRTLKSDNPMDIQGDLHGSATFSPSKTPTDPSSSSSPSHSRDMLYHEEGDMPRTLGIGLRWTKKYIWRLSETGRISVWFVKVGTEDEPDYLFHEFEFGDFGSATVEGTYVSPPEPPAVQAVGTRVVSARGNHLCINDMYRTAYAFRIDAQSGEVLSWASRHVVKGPKKNQDIVNLYRLDG